ncbi:MAG TPA: histidine kinase [Casimicrobiaceae bacterium]|nr:histidine kinase [Casimicrobiaceae bacterium]
MTASNPPSPSIHDFHPLEFIPWFRRFPCSPVRDLVYTFIWNGGLGVFFSLLALIWSRAPFLDLLWINFVYAQFVGYSIHGLFFIAHAVMPRKRLETMTSRFVFFAGVPLLGVLCGFMLGNVVLGAETLPRWMHTGRGAVLIAFNSLLISGILLAVLLPRERAARAEAAVAHERARVAAAERETALAQMRALQAQVEPHFLYNTLAHVASLIDSEPRDARTMLDRLIALLRSTAVATNGDATLASQVELLRAYLEILAMRMGDRLRWTIDVAPDVANVVLPPALLQPLVENAIKHGLEPKVDGGTVALDARRIDDRLVITVSDTGVGFAAETVANSTKLGLVGLRKRLAMLYNDAAKLTLAEQHPSGVRATIMIRWSMVHE